MSGSDSDFGSRMAVAMRAADLASPGASAKRLVNDPLDGAGATATFRAATEAAIKLLSITRKIFGGLHGVADVMVAQHVAGTDDH